MSKACKLTTIDNPYDPFEQFNDWFMYDNEKGYNSCAFLARIVDELYSKSDEYDSEDDPELIEKAIDQIIQYDFQDIYVKVTQN